MKKEAKGRQRGQTLVETALVLPVLLLLIAAIATFGFLFNGMLAVTNASREGARSGAVGDNATTVRATVTSYLVSAGLDPAQATVGIQTSGGKITVQVTYPMRLPFSIPGVPDPVPLGARSVMRIE